MKITLINNHTFHLDELMLLLSKYTVEVCDYQNVATYNFADTDLIILSGGHHLSVENHHHAYRKELDLVLESDKPLFGICLGFQIICAAYGNHLTLMKSKTTGLFPVQKLVDDPIFEGIKAGVFIVAEAHRRVVEDVDGLDVLARSPYGIEVIKVPEKLHYGVQFHPEMFIQNSVGHLFLENFLKIAFAKEISKKI